MHTMNIYKTAILGMLTLMIGSAAYAAPVPNDLNPANFLTSANQVVQNIDQGHIAEIWAGASVSVKPMVSKDIFVKNVTLARQPLGLATSRVWRSIQRQTIPANKSGAPGGEYVSVSFQTQFAGPRVDVASIHYELISFHADADGVWRLAGYYIQ